MSYQIFLGRLKRHRRIACLARAICEDVTDNLYLVQRFNSDQNASFLGVAGSTFCCPIDIP